MHGRFDVGADDVCAAAFTVSALLYALKLRRVARSGEQAGES